MNSALPPGKPGGVLYRTRAVSRMRQAMLSKWINRTIGAVKCSGFEHTQLFEFAAWWEKWQVSPGIQSLTLRAGNSYDRGEDYRILPAIKWQATVTSAYLASHFGGVPYGKDTAGAQAIGQAREYSQDFSIIDVLRGVCSAGGPVNYQFVLLPEFERDLIEYLRYKLDREIDSFQKWLGEYRALPETEYFSRVRMVEHCANCVKTYAGALSELQEHCKRDSGYIERAGGFCDYLAPLTMAWALFVFDPKRFEVGALGEITEAGALRGRKVSICNRKADGTLSVRMEDDSNGAFKRGAFATVQPYYFRRSE